MCLYPRLVQNPKYKPNKKNGGNVPTPTDKRLLAVPIKCGKCIECRRALSREWHIRLCEELKNQQGYFVTLTFDENALLKHNELATQDKFGEIANENETATKAVRLFLERWRKKYGKSCKHWLITELGHTGTERVHLHGIIFTEQEKIKDLDKTWNNGYVHIGTYCNNQTINYITKYITKIDNEHKDFTGKILCSAGIGAKYINEGKKFNAYNSETKEYYRSKEGYKRQLPIYYRNHIYTEEQREKLWLEKLDKQERWINGIKFDISTREGAENYMNALKTAQKDNIKNGFGSIDWKTDTYKESMKKINKNWEIKKN